MKYDEWKNASFQQAKFPSMSNRIFLGFPRISIFPLALGWTFGDLHFLKLKSILYPDNL